MQPGNYRVDLVGMQNLIDKAVDFEKRLEDRLSDIRKQVTNLHIDWTGQAAQTHQQASAEWDSGATEMHTALGELRKALDHARSAYHNAGETNHGMWPQ
ncbi:WXG100 family type VII secretion target [Nocardia aobensis]|uniref:ESAT-6-like protein n=1 Tax=Nocardia aobensis TaxID=257277 RepID=A0ABW6P499_9NOCA